MHLCNIMSSTSFPNPNLQPPCHSALRSISFMITSSPTYADNEFSGQSSSIRQIYKNKQSQVHEETGGARRNGMMFIVAPLCRGRGIIDPECSRVLHVRTLVVEVDVGLGWIANVVACVCVANLCTQVKVGGKVFRSDLFKA